VNVPAGDYAASKIGIRVFDGGVEMKDASFTLYLANNAAAPTGAAGGRYALRHRAGRAAKSELTCSSSA